jgi:hypothetical protein
MLIALSAVILAAPLHAQERAGAIDPGMTRDQVVAKFGEPATTRTLGTMTYLMYQNDCAKRCGMTDLVVLDSGKVVDAVFRSPNHFYTGHSSSPDMITAENAKKGVGDPLLVAAPDSTHRSLVVASRKPRT